MRIRHGEYIRRIRRQVEAKLTAAGALRQLTPEEIAALAPTLAPPTAKQRIERPDPPLCRQRFSRRYVRPLHEEI
jgi:hypothetical protein